MDVPKANMGRVKGLLLLLEKTLEKSHNWFLAKHVMRAHPMKTFAAIVKDSRCTEEMIKSIVEIVIVVTHSRAQRRYHSYIHEVTESGLLEAILPLIGSCSAPFTLVDDVILVVKWFIGMCVKARDVVLRAGGARLLVQGYYRQVYYRDPDQISQTYILCALLGKAMWYLASSSKAQHSPPEIAPLEAFALEELPKFKASNIEPQYDIQLLLVSRLSESESFAKKLSQLPKVLRLLVQTAVNVRAEGPILLKTGVQIIGNLCRCTDDAITQAVVDAGAVAACARVFRALHKTDATTSLDRKTSMNICSDILWIFSNITAGTISQAKAVYNCPSAVAVIQEGLYSQDKTIAEEAMFCVGADMTGLET